MASIAGIEFGRPDDRCARMAVTPAGPRQPPELAAYVSPLDVGPQRLSAKEVVVLDLALEAFGVLLVADRPSTEVDLSERVFVGALSVVEFLPAAPVEMLAEAEATGQLLHDLEVGLRVVSWWSNRFAPLDRAMGVGYRSIMLVLTRSRK